MKVLFPFLASKIYLTNVHSHSPLNVDLIQCLLTFFDSLSTSESESEMEIKDVFLLRIIEE